MTLTYGLAFFYSKKGDSIMEQKSWDEEGVKSLENAVERYKKLLEINEYYHDQLLDALILMRTIQEADLKHNVKLPEYLYRALEEFTESFKFRYVDREESE
jgi:hypothetical protein